MKILVIGLDAAAPEILLGDDRLATIRSLMEVGCYGRLESVVPPTSEPAWMCLATGQDPGSLGVYGSRNRTDRSYKAPGSIDARSIQAPAIWDRVAESGGRSILVGVPPDHPPRPVNGIAVGGLFTPDATEGAYTHPPELAATIEKLVGTYPVDAGGLRSDDEAALRDQILDASRKQFALVRHLIENEPWDYFQLVETGLDRIQRAFWRHHDPEHVLHTPDSPFADVVRDYYLHLDGELATVLDLLTEDTLVLVVSAHGARRPDGGFRLDEWLVREGLLALKPDPEQATPAADLDVDWGRTRAWSEAGDSAAVFLNVKGREPEGTIDPADYESFRDELKARLEAVAGPDGEPLGALVFKPEEVYQTVRNVAPDLIVDFGGLDGCNPAQHGAFILASPQLPPFGEIEGARLLDVAPTLLELAGPPPLPDAPGRNLLQGLKPADSDDAPPIDDDELVRDRLRGLGYIG